MANQFGIQLSRAIRSRAYATGSLDRKAKRVETLKAALKAAEQDLQEVRAQLEEIDKSLASLSAVNTADIRPIQHFPKSGLFKRGEMSNEIVRLLKASAEPIQTPVLVMLVSKKLGLPTESAEDWAITRRRVLKQLQAYARKGAIQRLYAQKTTEVGAWRWSGI
jgi:hypothetical protein